MKIRFGCWSALLSLDSGTTLIAGLVICTRKLSWCKSTSQYPYLGGETAIAGNNIEVEPDGQPIGEMCGSNDDADIYDEIRNSFQYNCSNSWVDSCPSPCCGNGTIISDSKTRMSQNIYSKYEDEGQYSTLRLKKRQSADSNMDGWPRREGACSSQEEYTPVKSSGIIGDPAKKKKKGKIQNREQNIWSRFYLAQTKQEIHLQSYWLYF
ncbi:uncharacterized protein LOC125664890 [Ostrea edulis]|uniref:uncharacterized protein LOC125664890 n=1 Tax=Ostrea edulis TaxID=37623 RepID=UPI0020952262|nr:uncharacterized protein LOC125664890 [Ostrea edulis]